MSIFDKHKPQTHTASRIKELATHLKQQAYELALLNYQEHGDKSQIEAEHFLPLAKLAEARGEAQTALSLIEGFSQQHPNHPDTLALYLLAANIMHRNFGQTQDALALLNRLAQQFPDSPEISTARQTIVAQQS